MRKNEKSKKRLAKRRNNAMRKDEKTKPATRKDEILARKDEKTPFETLFCRLFAWRLLVFSHGVFSLRVISSYRLFAWRLFVFSRRKDAMRKDAKTKRRHAKRQKDENTPCENTKRRHAKTRKDAMRKTK